MALRRTAVFVSLAVAAGVLGVPAPASACSLTSPGPTEEEQLARADLVFEGVAVSHRDPNAGAPLISSADPIFWTFVVDREIKGAPGPLQEVGTARSDASCGYRFETGARYRVFAGEQNGAFMTGLGSGTRRLSATDQTSTTLAPSTTTTVPTARPPTMPGQPRPLALTG